MREYDGAHARGSRGSSPIFGLWQASLALAGLGALDSVYLTWVKLSNTQAFCSGAGGCETVNSSAYSEIRGIPIALIGLAAYLTMALILVLERRRPGWRDYGLLAVFGLALTGTLYSAYLTYVELFVIFAVCPYCVASALIVTSILVLSVVRLVRGLPDDEPAG